MTISRWKIMACTLGLSVGGLAVCVGQSNNQLHKADPKIPQANYYPQSAINPTKPASPKDAPNTLPPLAIGAPVPAVPPTVQEFELELPMPPQSPAFPAVEGTPPKETSAIMPVGLNRADPLPKPREVVAPTGAPSFPSNFDPLLSYPPTPAVPNFDVPAGQGVPAPVAVESRPNPTPPMPVPPQFVPMVVASPGPPAAQPRPLPPAPPSPQVIDPPAPQPPSVQPMPTAAPTQKLKMLLRMGVGTPRFEIRNSTGEDLLLKVTAEKIEMKSVPESVKSSPLAGVTACGKVKFTAPGIEGNCDELSILSGTGEVLLKGNVHMKTKLKAKSWSEMTADKMIYQIGGSGMTTATSTNRSTFTPVDYHENH